MTRQRQAAGSVLLGMLIWAVAGRADEAAAVKAIEELGGTVWRDDKQPGKPVVGVSLYETRVTDAVLKELKELKNLQKLNLRLTQVTDAGLKELKELKRLQWLDLAGTKVTDVGLKELKDLKHLQSLNLSYTRVTDAGVQELKAARPGLLIDR